MRTSRTGRAGVFVDRDGTLIEDRHYLGDPEGVVLLPGAASAIARLNQAGLPVLLVTNQSGIGRGYFSVDDFGAVQRRLVELLADEGARLDGVYHCPHSPDAPGACDCRKPRTGLFRRAAEEHDLDLARSAYIGDRLRDVLPAGAFGGIGYLVRADAEPVDVPATIRRVPSFARAVEDLLQRRSAV